MKHIRNAAFVAALALTLIGCSKNSNPVSPGDNPDQSNGRISIYNDETYLNTDLTTSDDSVGVDTTTGLSKTSQTQKFSMKLIAQISPPTVNKQKVQATSVSLDGSYAYISYNMAGDAYVGAIDVVYVNGKSTKIVSRATFTDTDVSSVFYFNNNVYMAEATGNASYSPPAIAELISIKSGKLDLTGNVRSQLSSFTATSIAAGNGMVYAVTGNTGGLYTLTSDSLKILSYAPLTDARWVDFSASNVVVAQGTPGRVSVFDVNNMSAPLNTYNFPGADIAQSKSTVQLIGGKALIAAGDSGVQLMNLSDGKIVGSIPRLIVKGLDPSVTVTNAVAGAGNYIYISDGEAGVYVAQASQALENLSGDTPIKLTVLGKLTFSKLQSVNHVAFNGSTLVVASGTGGVKIVTVSF
jgi:hypothetical protein